MTNNNDSLPKLEFDANGNVKAATKAERIVLNAVKAGKIAKITSWIDSKRTINWILAHTIRAEFLRHLCIHPDKYDVDPLGIRIENSLVTGELKLNSCTLTCPLVFNNCRFDQRPEFEDAITRFLSFNSCYLPGLNADSISVGNSLWLSNCEVSDAIYLSGAVILGDLRCEYTSFTPPVNQTNESSTDGADAPVALDAEGIKVSGTVDLSYVKAMAEVSFMNADISGDMTCQGSAFSNEHVSQDPDLKTDAFLAQRMVVSGRLFLMEMSPIKGHLDFRDAHVGGLVDDRTCCPKPGQLWLDCFIYDSLDDYLSTVDRLSWLERMPAYHHDSPVFWPQPYEQLIRVLKSSGHEYDARLIAIAKQEAYLHHLQEEVYFRGAYSSLRIKWMRFVRATMRFGYEPWRVMRFIGIAFLFGFVWFWGAYHFDYMAPSKERVYLEPCYVGTQTTCPGWVSYDRKIIGQIGAAPLLLPNEYPEFNSIYYALDTFFPIVDLHQEAYWSPRSEGIWGGTHRFIQWALIISGWILTTIAVAGFTGLIKKEDK